MSVSVKTDHKFIHLYAYILSGLKDHAKNAILYLKNIMSLLGLYRNTAKSATIYSNKLFYAPIQTYHSYLMSVIRETTWWRHELETFFALLALGELPSQRPVTRSVDVFFDLRLNKRLSKPSRRRWFEMLLRSLWCHCNANFKFDLVHCKVACSIAS